MTLWNSPASVADLQAMGRNTIHESLGIEITEVGADYVRGRIPVDRRTHQPYGLLHGGASVVLAESLGSIAAGLVVAGSGARVVGIEVNANHLRAVREGWVTGTARALHIGRTTQVWEIRLQNEDGELTCISRLTMAVVPARPPA